MKPIVPLELFDALDIRVGTIQSLSDLTDGSIQLELQFDGFTRSFSLAGNRFARMSMSCLENKRLPC